MNFADPDVIRLALVLTVALIGFISLSLWKAYKELQRPVVNPEGTAYESPITYSILLTAPCGKGLITALREWDPEIILIDANRLSAGGTCLAKDVRVDRAISLVDKILEHQSDAEVQIVCNKFNSVFTMKEWKEFHDG